MPKLETAIQKEILDLLNGLPYTVAWKVMQANERGVPDVLCCHNGRFIGIEVKKPGGKLSAIQIEQGKRIQDAKGIWIVTNSLIGLTTQLLLIVHEKEKMAEVEEALRK